jgi:hypothetical protein
LKDLCKIYLGSSLREGALDTENIDINFVVSILYEFSFALSRCQFPKDRRAIYSCSTALSLRFAFLDNSAALNLFIYLLSLLEEIDNVIPQSSHSVG